MKFNKSRAFILRIQDYSESDLIIEALLEEGEKKSFIAKGARRSKKRFGPAVLQPTHLVSLSYMESKTSLSYLTEAKLLDDFPSLRQSYQRLKMALYFLVCVGKVFFNGSGVQGQNLFLFLGHSFRALEKTQNLPFLEHHFKASLLKKQGVLPKELENSPEGLTPISEHAKMPTQLLPAASLDRCFDKYLEMGTVV